MNSVFEDFEVIVEDGTPAVPAEACGLAVEVPIEVVRNSLEMADRAGQKMVSLVVGMGQLARLSQCLSGVVTVGGQSAPDNEGARTDETEEKEEREEEQGPTTSRVASVTPQVGDVSSVVGEYSFGADVCFCLPDWEKLDAEIEEMLGDSGPQEKTASVPESPEAPVVVDRMSRKVDPAPVMRVTVHTDGRRVAVKRPISLERAHGGKKRRGNNCRLCANDKFFSTPIRRHAVRNHLPWFITPETACWTCKEQFGSSTLLKRHMDEEREKAESDPRVVVEPHQMFGQEHIVAWCELCYGFLQQSADRVADGNLEGLLQWCKVNVVDKSDSELHPLDQELLSVFFLFLEDVPRGKELAALVGWRSVYNLQLALADNNFQAIFDGVVRGAPGTKKWRPADLLPRISTMYDGHSHLDRWAAGVGRREARDRLEAMPYQTVTSYCFSRWWQDSESQDWWPRSRGPLKMAFGLHPSEAAEGISSLKWKKLREYVRGGDCVAVGEIGLDHVRVRSSQGRRLQAAAFGRLCRLATEVRKPVVIHCRGGPQTAEECLQIMRTHLSKEHPVYWHHFEEGEDRAREVEVAFRNVVFGVAPGILKEQLNDKQEKFIRSTAPQRLLPESDAPMVGERRSTNHPWAAGTVLKRMAAIKGVPLPLMKKLSQDNFSRLFGATSQ